jgi:hypothetical protein
MRDFNLKISYLPFEERQDINGRNKREELQILGLFDQSSNGTSAMIFMNNCLKLYQ